MEKQTAKPESFQQLIQSSIPVLVDFYADWCGPCKAMSPVVQEVARELNGKARVIKINIDKSESAAMKFNVQAVPTFLIFKNGTVVWRHAGMIDKQSLLRTIGQF
jgi:thioredoxin 1